MPALGIDIGSSSIKLIALSGSMQKPKLESFGLGVNPVGNIETENEQEQVQIATAVKKLVQDTGVKLKKINATLPESKVFSRVVEIPNLSEAELASAITWEAEQYIPVPISEVQLDYQVISRPQPGEGGKMRLFLVAAPKTVVSKLIHLLEMAGLEPESLETEVICLTRALIRDKSTPPILLLHLGAATTDISIVEGLNIVFTRTLSSGGTALSRSLASNLGLEVVQAEQYKRSYGLDARQLQGRVRQGLLPMFKTVIDEVKKAFHFYVTERQAKVQRVVLSGGGAYMPEITSEMARELGVEVVVADPLAGVAMDERQKAKLGGINAVFAVAVGSAMRNLK